MSQRISVDLSQNIQNALTAIADVERKKLSALDDFKPIANEYSVVNKDALADGDSMGRGTGVFLDVYNTAGGTIDDIMERKNEVKINKFDQNKTYPNF